MTAVSGGWGRIAQRRHLQDRNPPEATDAARSVALLQLPATYPLVSLVISLTRCFDAVTRVPHRKATAFESGGSFNGTAGSGHKPRDSTPPQEDKCYPSGSIVECAFVGSGSRNRNYPLRADHPCND